MIQRLGRGKNWANLLVARILVTHVLSPGAVVAACMLAYWDLRIWGISNTNLCLILLAGIAIGTLVALVVLKFAAEALRELELNASRESDSLPGRAAEAIARRLSSRTGRWWFLAGSILLFAAAVVVRFHSRYKGPELLILSGLFVFVAILVCRRKIDEDDGEPTLDEDA